MLKYLVWLWCFLFSGLVLGQGGEVMDWHGRYEFYRQRFLGIDGGGGFIVLGQGLGHSLPAASRNPEGDCSYDWHLLNAKCLAGGGRGLLEWSDATVHHGHYLATLATEIYLLKQAKQNYEPSLRELYLALYAIDRLDEQADVFLGLAPQRNGFLIRDDVPRDFFRDATQSSQRRFNRADGRAYDCLRSDAGCGTLDLNRGLFMSQDQVLALFLGLAFVVELIGEEELPETPYCLQDLVAEQSHRMITYLQKNRWWIHTPDGKKIPERWGGNVRGFNRALAQAGSRLSKKQFQKTYQRGSSKTIGRLTNWGIDKLFPLMTSRNYAMIYTCALLNNHWSARKMARRSRRSDQILYALCDAVLNRKPLSKKIKKAELLKILASAPPQGPCFKTQGCDNPPEWQAASRWWQMYYKNGNPYGLHYEHNGLDFMLFYNLCAILLQDPEGYQRYKPIRGQKVPALKPH